MSMPPLLILGCGYIGRRVARRYLEQGTSVLGVVRSATSAAELDADGIPSLACDLASDRIADLPLPEARVFHFAPPPTRGLEDIHTRRLVSAFERVGHPKRVVYISTTGVYGDCGGAWVDESWPLQPTADRARRRWDAEQSLRQWARGSARDLVVLRVAGIYGPGRLPLERIRQGLPLVREDEAPFSNRIHADDLVEICIAAMERGRPGGVYNVCDGHPTTMTDYFRRVADAAGLPGPPEISMREADEQLSVGMMSYMRESRRLSNRRLLEELQLTLHYPDLDSGLRASLP
jgi:nucleoside-diphosphate-sugar epimerase